MPRKAKKKQYFTQETENAIIRYNNSKDPVIRNRIYNEHIRTAFEKLAENIIHTFKFYYFDVPSEDVKHEVVSFLVLNIHKFKEGKGKAFSYFSIVAKNYLILNNNKNYKKYKNSDALTTLDYGRNLTSEKKEVEGHDFVKEFVDDMVDYWDGNLTKLFRKKRDIQIADAVIELFKRRSDLENFNKKALYIMIREMTDVKTQHITKVVNQMKSHYLKISENYYQTGSFSGRKIDISSLFWHIDILLTNKNKIAGVVKWLN